MIVDGQLPVSWVKSTISEICLVNPTVNKSKYSDNLLVSFVPMPAVEAETGRIDVSEANNPDKVVPAAELLRSIEQAREERYQQQLTDWQTAVEKWEFNGKEGKKPSKPKKILDVEQFSDDEKSLLPNLPDNWLWMRLVQIVEKIQIGPFGSLLHKEDYVVNGIPLVNPVHIQSQKIIPHSNSTVSHEKIKELGIYRLRENDIVLGRRGEMGICAVVN